MNVNIRSELVPSPWAYTVRPERRENENYKILVFSLLFFGFGFFWPDLATFYVSFGSFGLRPPGNPDEHVLLQVKWRRRIQE